LVANFLIYYFLRRIIPIPISISIPICSTGLGTGARLGRGRGLLKKGNSTGISGAIPTRRTGGFEGNLVGFFLGILVGDLVAGLLVGAIVAGAIVAGAVVIGLPVGAVVTGVLVGASVPTTPKTPSAVCITRIKIIFLNNII
jgi:hypothetical protein